MAINPQGLYAPTQEDIEASEYNRGAGDFATSIGGVLGALPQIRKQKKIKKYWQMKDIAIGSPITVDTYGTLNMEQGEAFKFGSQSEEWNDYKAYLESKRIQVSDEDYQIFKQIYMGKAAEYGSMLSNKFASMKMRGVSSSDIRDLVSNNTQLRDAMSRIGMVNPEVDAQFAPFLKAKEGLVGGLGSAIPEAGFTAAAWGALPAATAAYQKWSKNTPFLQNLKSKVGLGPAREFGQQMTNQGVENKALKTQIRDQFGKKGDVKKIKKAKSKIELAKNKLEKLQTKKTKVKMKKVSKSDYSKAQKVLERAKNKLEKMPQRTQSTTTIIKKTARKHGVKGIYKMLSKTMGKKGALMLLGRVGLGTALTGSGALSVFGVGMNALAAAQIAKALSKALNEVDSNSSLGEKVFGKKTASLAGSSF